MAEHFENYDSGITQEQWLDLLRDESIFNYECMCIMRRFFETGETSCKELAKKYSGNYSSYSGYISSLCRKIYEKTSCPIPDSNNSKSWSSWGVLFSWRDVENSDNTEGSFIFSLRPELKAALEKLNDEGQLDKYRLIENSYDWVPFYEEFSQVLYAYKEKQPELIKKLKNINDENINAFIINDEEISPFAVFESFNRNALNKKTSQKVKIYSTLKNEFELKSNIPTPPPEFGRSQYTDYFAKLQKQEGLIQTSWEFFDAIINKDDENFIKYHDEFLKYQYAGSVSLTTALYWMQATRFLPCTVEVRNKLERDFGIQLPARNLKGQEYLQLLKNGDLDNIPEFVEAAVKEYSGKDFSDMEQKNEKNNVQELANLLTHTHNLILHGAPGTGKTHLARDIATEMGAEVGFVQFHPSYDYTDFVEGLRPVNDGNGGQIGFERKDGVFKKFCERALLFTSDNSDFLKELNDNPTVWKVSLEGTGANPTRTDCMENGHIRIGWKGYGDVADFSSFTGYTEYGGSNVLVAFQTKMQIGDIVLSCWSATEIDAIGIVTGDYEYRVEGGDYPRYRTVKWLVKGIRENIVEKNHGKTLTLASVYKLSISIQDVVDIVRKYGKNEVKQAKNNFVFIIDEINRGEMSKIFGELFFSIDPGYRGKDGLIQTQYQNLVSENNIFHNGFYVPENVYIIGTMNDIDRNVESMDFAFRRRFTFKEITAKETQEQILSGLDDAIREKAIRRMDSLNDAISKIEGLSSAYHIGGAYFLKLKDFGNDFKLLWEYHLEGLLREYLRGMEDSDTKFEELRNAYFGNSAHEEING